MGNRNYYFVIPLLVFALMGSPLVFAQSSESNGMDEDLGSQVSDFVQESRDLFEQQKQETREVILQCIEDTKNAEPSQQDTVREQCSVL